jgi:parallel beta-helix repeat protein
VRCGGNAYLQQQPALQIGNGGDGQGVGVVSGVTVSNNTVKNSLFNAVGFSTSSMITLLNNTVDTPGLDGIVIGPAHFEAPTGSASITGNKVLNLSGGHVAFSNLSQAFMATLSGNNW